MPYYALTYDVVDDYAARRVQYRDEHLALGRQAHERGVLLMAGAFDPIDGALLIFHAPNRDVVDDFVRRDPYVVNGLVTHWTVKTWTVVVGNAEASVAGTT